MICWRLLIVDFFPDAETHLDGIREFLADRLPHWSWINPTRIAALGANEALLSPSEDFEELALSLIDNIDSSIEYSVNILSSIFCVRSKISAPAMTSYAILLDDKECQLYKDGVIDTPSLGLGNLRPVNVERSYDFITSSRYEVAGLLSGALNACSPAASFISYIRLFEAAFALSHNKLRKPLNRFLASGTLGIPKKEIDDWVELRHKIAHSDRTGHAGYDGYAFPYLERIKQAAYDVAFNKKKWKSPDADRLDTKCISVEIRDSAHIATVAGATICINIIGSESLGKYPSSDKDGQSFDWQGYFKNSLDEIGWAKTAGILAAFGLQNKDELFG